MRKPSTPLIQTFPPKPVEDSLYAKHEKIYPRKAYGLFSNLKTLSSLTLLGIYYTFPWLQWDNRQAVLFDLPARKFYVFNFVFWPQDFIYLAFLLIIAALALFFFTTLAGRLWCGFACPQTVWTDIFIRMERLVEGDRTQQMKLDRSPLTFRKFRIKATKQTLWIVFSLFTGLTFVGYFSPIRDLTMRLFEFNLGGWETFWFFFYSFATYGNAGFLRDQVCIYMCPYARFQSAMFDHDTMIIAYDERRGEPRGSRKRGQDYKTKNLGQCVNCTLCVQVCPMGIDIRDGLQYQCISCSACVDACNEIMDKMDYPRGLIRYTTESNLKGQVTHILRPRPLIYGSILLAIFIGIGYGIWNRVLVQMDVLRDRNMLYRETPAGLIENVYILKVMNKDDKLHTYQITISGVDGLQLVSQQPVITVESGDVLSVPVSLRVDPQNLNKVSTKVMITVTAQDNPQLTVTEESRFLGPLPAR